MLYLQGVDEMGPQGFEPPGLLAQKQRFTQNSNTGGAKSGAVESDFIKKLLHKYPQITTEIQASNLAENLKKDLINLILESERK